MSVVSPRFSPRENKPIPRTFFGTKGWRHNQSYEVRQLACKSFTRDKTKKVNNDDYNCSTWDFNYDKLHELNSYLTNKKLTTDQHLAPTPDGNSLGIKYYPKAPPNSPVDEPKRFHHKGLSAIMAQRSKNPIGNQILLAKKMPSSTTIINWGKGNSNNASMSSAASSGANRTRSYSALTNNNRNQQQLKFPSGACDYSFRPPQQQISHQLNNVQKFHSIPLSNNTNRYRNWQQQHQPQFEMKGEQLTGFSYVQKISQGWEKMMVELAESRLQEINAMSQSQSSSVYKRPQRASAVSASATVPWSLSSGIGNISRQHNKSSALDSKSSLNNLNASKSRIFEYTRFNKK